MKELIIIFLFAGCGKRRGEENAYSPSDPLMSDSDGGGGSDADEEMDWQTNLKGVKTLFDTEDEETEAPDKAGGPSHKESSRSNGGGDSSEKSVGGVISQESGAGVQPVSHEQTAAAAADQEAATEAASAAAAAAAVAEEAANLAERVRQSLEEQKAAEVARLSKMLAYDAVLEAR
jgi:hypothetical protein